MFFLTEASDEKMCCDDITDSIAIKGVRDLKAVNKIISPALIYMQPPWIASSNLPQTRLPDWGSTGKEQGGYINGDGTKEEGGGAISRDPWKRYR